MPRAVFSRIYKALRARTPKGKFSFWSSLYTGFCNFCNYLVFIGVYSVNCCNFGCNLCNFQL